MPRQPLHDRQRSLGRAVDIFWAQGFHATSLKDLERALDMRPGSIYAAFGSKEGLFNEALERYAQQGLKELEEQLDAYVSPLEGLAAYVRSLGGLHDQAIPSRACLLVKSLLELGAREPVARDRADALLAGMEKRFIAAFYDAQAAGELLPGSDPAQLGRRLQAEVMGLRAYAQRAVTSAAVRELAGDMAASIIDRRVHTRFGGDLL
ncbi:MAG: TetR/AcrR family transcriptional regulator [Salinisphaera sp.]|jgi:TetR/AcrR family transcriptional repressor of nem operon|nr:TetR/AcrR family transcriptional regulator [Salinisphaera sp.]